MSQRKCLSKQGQIFGYKAKDRLPEGHICFSINEIVDDLELGRKRRGAPTSSEHRVSIAG